jgi:CheY-like chemotaxis protein
MIKPKLGLVAVRDLDCRSTITTSLRRLGWSVVEYASGFHLVQAMSDVIGGGHGWPNPDLIVVDSISPGCSGLTIAAGFRDLGIEIPIILVGPRKAQAKLEPTGPEVILIEPAAAATALVVLAKLLPKHRTALIDVTPVGHYRSRHVR